MPWLLRSSRAVNVFGRLSHGADVRSEMDRMLVTTEAPRTGHAGDTRFPRARHDGRPRVSIVTVARDDSAATLRTMVERSARWERFGVESIIVCASRRLTKATVSAMTGLARLIQGPADASDAQLRAVGFAAATGDVVMLVDDPSSVDDGWIEHVSNTGVARGVSSPREANRHAGGG